MTTVFTIRQEPTGLWMVDRDGMPLIKHDSAAAAISDGRELARMIPRAVRRSGHGGAADAKYDDPLGALRQTKADLEPGCRLTTDDPINLRDDLSRAHWCGHFSCSERELIDAVRITYSIDVGTVGLYLATRFDPHAEEESE